MIRLGWVPIRTCKVRLIVIVAWFSGFDDSKREQHTLNLKLIPLPMLWATLFGRNTEVALDIAVTLAYKAFLNHTGRND